MHHGPAVTLEKDEASEIKSKLGIKLFWVYCLVYGGFVAINLVNTSIMEKHVIFGLNLAVVYGFGLIVFAVILGLIYNAICTGLENKLNR